MTFSPLCVTREIAPKPSMSVETKHFYEFGHFRIDTEERVLLREGKLVHLTGKAFDVLLVLVERSGRIVEEMS